MQAIAPYLGGVIASEYEWGNFRFVEGLKAPRKTRLVYLDEHKTEEMVSNIPGAVWGLDSSQDGTLFAYFGWIDAYRTLNFTSRSEYVRFITKMENFKYKFGTYRLANAEFVRHAYTELFDRPLSKNTVTTSKYSSKDFVVCEFFESNSHIIVCIDKFTDGKKSKVFHLPGYRIIYWNYDNQKAFVKLEGIASWPSLIGGIIYLITDAGEIRKIGTEGLHKWRN